VRLEDKQWIYSVSLHRSEQHCSASRQSRDR